MGRELPPRWVVVAGFAILAFAAVVVAVGFFFPRKLSAAETERALRRDTAYTSVSCTRETGRLWHGWDYLCTGRMRRQCDVIDVEVSANDVTDWIFQDLAPDGAELAGRAQRRGPALGNVPRGATRGVGLPRTRA
jgi:hypothetical protein